MPDASSSSSTPLPFFDAVNAIAGRALDFFKADAEASTERAKVKADARLEELAIRQGASRSAGVGRGVGNVLGAAAPIAIGLGVLLVAARLLKGR